MVAAGCGAASAQYYGGLNFDLPPYSAGVRGGIADTAPGFFVTNTALDDRRVRYGLKLGYEFSPQLALVSRYSSFERRDSASSLARSYGLDLERRIPLIAGFVVSGSAGIARLRSDTTFGSDFYSGLFSSSGSRTYTAGRLGLGMAYQFNGNLGLHFDVERYRAFRATGMGELDADHLSLGMMLKF
jgi:hypothetical protein